MFSWGTTSDIKSSNCVVLRLQNDAKASSDAGFEALNKINSPKRFSHGSSDNNSPLASRNCITNGKTHLKQNKRERERDRERMRERERERKR